MLSPTKAQAPDPAAAAHTPPHAPSTRTHTRRPRLLSTRLIATGVLIAGLFVTGCATTPAENTVTAETPTAASPPATAAECGVLPTEFVYLTDINPNITVDVRYATTHNFTGEIVRGYEDATDVVLLADAADALSQVQQQFEADGLGLLVYDGFRPTRAVDHFVEWSHTPDDHTKAEFYPTLEKPELFEQGYIAAESNHSRGGTVDLTLIDTETGDPLDMGGEFDLFDERSHGDSEQITPEQAANRALLSNTMIAAGYAPYAEEWWHYSYPVPEGTERQDFALKRC